MNTIAPLFLAFSLLSTQSGSVLRDSSPHQVRLVTVDTSVRLEVLIGEVADVRSCLWAAI